MRLRNYLFPILAIGIAAATASAWCDGGSGRVGEFRFPMPEFESGYKHPAMNTPGTNLTNPAVDVAALVGALSFGAWLAVKRRSRRELFLLALGSLLYFGFYRKGCICSVGSVQNVLAALFVERADGIPWAVLAFFLIPLLFALYFGRVFCAAVCPLGAIQEMAAIYPVQLSRPLLAMLGFIPYAYLGLVVLGVLTESGYLICRYDPFVGFFRQGASFNMLVAGGALLAVGVFIGRPYCRFFCPYGVLLRWVSRFSKWRANVTPGICVQCHLCVEACPYGAINVPVPAAKDLTADRRRGGKRLGFLLVSAPAIIVLGAWAGMMSHDFLARLHPAVRLAERMTLEDQGRFAERSIDSDAFRAGKKTAAELYAEVHAVREKFKYGAAGYGGFLGLVLMAQLIGLSVVRRREDYEADRGACVGCGRCFVYCPVENEHVIRK